LALVEGCKHALEISVPAEDVAAETERAVAAIQKKARLPGFRPGKAPASLVRKHFESDIRQEVLDALIPKHFRAAVEREGLEVVSRPNISDVHLHGGEHFHFKAEFEVAPRFDLGEYRGIEVPYEDPVVTDEDVERGVERLRDENATFVNIDPRPLEDGDYAVVTLESLAGIEGPPVKQDEVTLHIGGDDTVAAFSDNLRGASPGDEREFDVTYPEDYAQSRLAGKTIRFHAVVKGIRRKELPEANDEFAKDVGDYKTLDELREFLRKSLTAEGTFRAHEAAKGKIIEKLVSEHEFPLPDTYIDRQIQSRLEEQLAALARQNIDVSKLNLDWEKLRETHKERAVREVKASLLLEKIAEREAIAAMKDEVDRELERIAKQRREPVAATRMRFEKDGTLGRIASHIQTEKTLNFLFEHATKVAGAEGA